MSIARSLLKEKAWYRAVKVLYIAGILLIGALVIGGTYSGARHYVCSKGFVPDGMDRCSYVLDGGGFFWSVAIGLVVLWVAAYLLARTFFFVVCNESFWKRPRKVFDF